MNQFKAIGILTIALGLFLAACTGKTATTPPAVIESEAADTPPAAASQPDDGSSDLTRTDSQGAVTFEVKPGNLDNNGETLIFDVTMDTHSVDLSMDLAPLATLTTDNGQTVQGTQWDAPRGGHHVEGNLVFPATLDGKPFLEGAKELTLTIKDVEAPTRVFTWEITR